MSDYPPPARTETVRLTVSQAVVRCLAQQYTERDGQRTHRYLAGCGFRSLEIGRPKTGTAGTEARA